jgi:hypothetical protein
MVTVHFTWNWENLSKGCEIYWKTLRRVWLTPYLGAIFVAASIYGALYTHPNEWTESLYGIFLGLLFFCLRPLTVWQLGRAIRRSSHYGTEMIYTFDPDKVANFGEKHFGAFAWKQLESAVVTQEGILLCPSKNLFHWIPAAAFTSPDDMKTVEGFLKDHGIRTKIV